jgi:hypothetical protein
MGFRGKVAEQERARELRAQAWTLQEIATELAVSRSSVSLWVRDVEFEPKPREWSSAVARRRGANALQQRKAVEIAELLEEGRRRIGAMGEREFLVAGAALYAGEGAKRDGAVIFANSDPRMIAFFCAWLRNFFPVEEPRWRLRLYLHEGLDLADANAFWASTTGIPESQFLKPYRAIADPSIRNSKHPMGCPSVRYSCSRTHRRVMGLVHALLESPFAIPG